MVLRCVLRVACCSLPVVGCLSYVVYCSWWSGGRWSLFVVRCLLFAAV